MELSASDLRIGNLIYGLYENDSDAGVVDPVEKELCEVVGLDSVGFSDYKIWVEEKENTGIESYDEFIGIPLSEDWLIKFDLPTKKVIGGKTPYNKYSIRNQFDIYCYFDTSGNCLIYGQCYEGEDFFIIKCDTVHKFQDIYKMLTEKELKIKQYA